MSSSRKKFKVQSSKFKVFSIFATNYETFDNNDNRLVAVGSLPSVV